MALAVTDLQAYRHRRETKREQDLRLELEAVAEDVQTALGRIEPHMARLWIVARELGPQTMHAWNAVAYEQQRIAALVSPNDEPDAA